MTGPLPPESPSDEDSLAARRRARIDAAFGRAERDGLRIGLHARFAALAVLAFWTLATQKSGGTLFYGLSVVSLFAASGLAYAWLTTHMQFRRSFSYALVAVDALLLSVLLVTPNPFEAGTTPPPMMLRGEGFLYFFVLLGLVALSYSPGLVLWFGFLGSIGRAGAIAVIALDPRAHVDPSLLLTPLSGEEKLVAYLDPWFVDLTAQAHNILLLLIVSGTLALVVSRSRRLVFRQAVVERERANLARYFSPTMIDELAETDVPLGQTRRQDVAVLFADIVGFTSLASQRMPEQVIALLRDFQGRMEECAFAHRGTVDKYIGDAAMVTFGTPYPAPDDARRALDCAHAMIDAIADWNRQRIAEGEPPIRIGIGIHFGPAVLGDIGSKRRLEFAVVGDTVNVASRIEGLTRTLGVDLLASDAFMARARQAGADTSAYVDLGPQALRGREEPVRVWGYGAARFRVVSAAP
ncbi:MAG TPA: adenylate/guanylate cyclase domain-containing protein [Alphaproteobacteria bacterium]|nr:adenylate/guanylate cyclase domain-containing protein [Alphaproteobacteria bacterium]